jgi:alpha-ketoglutarate-dependent taurine dioxygenase
MSHMYEPIHDQTIWTGDQLHQTKWIMDVDLGHLSRQASDRDNVPPVSDTFVRRLAEETIQRLETGPGVALVRGLNVRSWKAAQCSSFLTQFGNLLGTPRPQDRRGTTVFSVVDANVSLLGEKSGHVRGSNSNVRIGLHTENDGEPIPPRLLAFLCIRQAAAGGETLLASGGLIYNLLLDASPAALRRLSRPINFARRPEDYNGSICDLDSVFTPLENKMRVRYSRYWIRRATEVRGVPHDRETTAALAAFDEILANGQVPTSIRLDEGDLLVINNYFVLHGRAAFSDGSSTSGRHLLRLWLD